MARVFRGVRRQPPPRSVTPARRQPPPRVPNSVARIIPIVTTGRRPTFDQALTTIPVLRKPLPRIVGTILGRRSVGGIVRDIQRRRPGGLLGTVIGVLRRRKPFVPPVFSGVLRPIPPPRIPSDVLGQRRQAPKRPPRKPEIKELGNRKQAPLRTRDPLQGIKPPGVSLMDRITSQISKSGGLARQNRYKVLIPVQALVGKSQDLFIEQFRVLQFTDEAVDWYNDFFGVDPGEMTKSLEAYCERSELPSYQLQLETVHTYGPQLQLPFAANYQDITMTFLCGNDMNERYFFDTWMHMIMDPLTNNFNYLNEYSCDITILQLQENATKENGSLVLKPNYAVTLTEAFPVAINAQNLGYDSNDVVQKVQVTFTYTHAIPRFSTVFDNLGSHESKNRRGVLEQHAETIRVLSGT